MLPAAHLLPLEHQLSLGDHQNSQEEGQRKNHQNYQKEEQRKNHQNSQEEGQRERSWFQGCSGSSEGWKHKSGASSRPSAWLEPMMQYHQQTPILVEVFAQIRAKNGAIDPISDGPRSSDEFIPPVKSGDPNDEELDPSEDEGQVTKPGRKKKSPKGAARKAVEGQRESYWEQHWQQREKGRSPLPPSKLFLMKKSKAPTKAAIGGLHEEWKRGRAPSSSCAVSEQSKSAGPAMSIDAFSDRDAAAVPPLSDYRCSRPHSSLSLEAWYQEGKHYPWRSPQEIRTLFHTKFKTRLIQDVGTLPAWHGLDNWEDVADIWDNVFPVHVLAKNPDLQIVVQKLAEDKLDSWHHKFATAAVEALSSCFNLWKLETAEEPVETVKWLLQGTENSCVFYYWSYHDELEDGVAEDAGIFQSYLIANTLATHYKAIYGPHVKQALNYSKTGKLVIPPQRLGEFSKTNWGDKTEFYRGLQVTITTMSALVALVNRLTAKQWTRIIATAINTSQPCKSSHAAKAITINAEELAPVDFEIIDNDSVHG
ncbi:hypothetical protein B0H10DRAFT_2324390 [Mycena sp. CBHHK59/15]|nr:hypothetical protein B0H10DRAFT_2324390 [Mycena sp. CBHHK59/15]